MADHPRVSTVLCDEAEHIEDEAKQIDNEAERIEHVWERIAADRVITDDECAEMTTILRTHTGTTAGHVGHTAGHVGHSADHDHSIATVVAVLRVGEDSPRVRRLRREREARLRYLRPGYRVIADGSLTEKAA